jgi:hypothetical protein
MSVHSPPKIIGQIAYMILRHFALRVSSDAGYTVIGIHTKPQEIRGDDL